MATLIDERPEEETPDSETVASLEDLATPVEEPVVPEVDELPEKYRGKSLKDLVQMHQESEKVIGRQGTELGDSRKVIDDYIKTQLTPQPQAAEEVDFFTDPDKAVAHAIESHPAIKQANEASQSMRQNAAQHALRSRHPDMDTIIQDKGFAEWISASKVRTDMLKEADSQYDYEKADELFNLWKDRQQVVTQTAKVEEQARKQQIKQASTGNTRASGEPTGRKVYRRADIIKLMKDDPSRYESMADEILVAYAEGRVK